MKKIGLIAAMGKELSAMLERLGQTTVFSTVGKRKVLLLDLGEKQIYIMESGIGEILAAGAAQYLISVCGVEAIVNFGVCGSLKSRHGLKKTVLVEGVIHYEMDTSAIDGIEPGRYEFLPTPVIPLDRGLLEIADSLSGGLDKVICASGNKFIAEQADKDYLLTFGADVCEMESAGIALTCLASDVPCLMVKAISDGEGGADEFKATVEQAARVYTDLVAKLIERM